MKIALITGATKGIGKAIALKCLQEGCFVYINYSSDENAKVDFEKEIENYRGNFAFMKADLADLAGVDIISNTIKNKGQKIDYLFLNAAVTNRTPFGSIEPEDWYHVMNVNLNNPFFLIQKLANAINTSGRIIFIGAMMGVYPHAMSIAYSVSKAGIHMLTQQLVKYFAEKNITVNAILPGFVDTPWQLTKDPNHRKRIENKIALHRFAKPEEIAELCWQVVQNGYINGSLLKIDGGYCYE